MERPAAADPVNPDALLGRAGDGLRRCFGVPPAATALAPGRVNLIGEHTDHNDGLVLPIAIDAWCAVAVAPSRGAVMRVMWLDVGEQRELPSGAGEADARCEASGAPIRPGSWVSYVSGVLGLVRRLGGDAGRSLPALDVAITTTVPIGGGLSSSASLEVSLAIGALAAWGITPPAPLDLARLCQRAEHEFAGVPCGLMDQCASLLARAGHAMLLDCRDLTATHVPVPASARIVVVDTGVRHALAAGAYASRRDECRRASAAMGIGSLRDADVDGMEEIADPVLRRRARHVVTENERVRLASAALEAGDLAGMGRLMLASHGSLRDDFEVSCRELDRAVEGLVRLAGVHGARMTGGGFGGCAIALADAQAAEGVAAAALGDGLGTSARVVAASAGAWALNGLDVTARGGTERGVGR